MSNYLTRLSTRVSHSDPAIRPRLTHRFEPLAGVESPTQVPSILSAPIFPATVSPLPKAELSVAASLVTHAPDEADDSDQSTDHVFPFLPDSEAPKSLLSLPLVPTAIGTSQATVPSGPTLTLPGLSSVQTDFAESVATEIGAVFGLSSEVTKPYASPLRAAARLPASNASALDSSAPQIQPLTAVTQQSDPLAQTIPQSNLIPAPDSHPTSTPGDGKGFLESLSSRAITSQSATVQQMKEQKADATLAIAPAAVFPQNSFESISEQSNPHKPEPVVPQTAALTGRAALHRTATHTIQPAPILQSSLSRELLMVAPEASLVGSSEQPSPLLVPLRTQGVQWINAASEAGLASAIAPVQPTMPEQPAAPPQTHVNVSIGRIEVRMTPPPRRPERPLRRVSQPSATRLSDYLQQGGQR